MVLRLDVLILLRCWLKYLEDWCLLWM